ncbi:MAG: hypothetical protein ACO3CN_06200, partial [Candidatus Nanopelagicales bacterium]
TASPTPMPTPTPSPTPMPTPSPTPMPTPTPTPTPTASPTNVSYAPLIPILKFKNFESKRCEIEIVNFDPNFEWVITSSIGSVKRVGNLITVESESEFTGTLVLVRTKKIDIQDGEESIFCSG